jgi:hypothetical protein
VGVLRFQIYNPGKITKYGALFRMLCEAKTQHISNMEIYTAQGKKLNDSHVSTGKQFTCSPSCIPG